MPINLIRRSQFDRGHSLADIDRHHRTNSVWTS